MCSLFQGENTSGADSDMDNDHHGNSEETDVDESARRIEGMLGVTMVTNDSTATGLKENVEIGNI